MTISEQLKLADSLTWLAGHLGYTDDSCNESWPANRRVNAPPNWSAA